MAVSKDTATTQPAVGTNILIVGSDERPQEDKGSGTARDVPGVRTDVMAVVSVSDDGKRVVAVSLPRDTDVSRPACSMFEYESKTTLSAPLPPASHQKLNSIYEQGGPKCLVDTVEKTTGMHIDSYVQFDFDTFSTVVDALGGVTIDTDKPLVDDVLGEIVPSAGQHTLDGNTALNFVRARKIEGETKNDFERIHRQQQFISALLRKLADGGVLSSPKTISSLVGKVVPELTIDNFSVADGLSLAQTLRTIGSDGVIMTTLPIQSEDNEFGNVVIDGAAAKELFNALKTGRPIEGQPMNDDGSVVTSVSSPGEASVMIVSPTQWDSRAQALQSSLKQQGVEVGTTTTEDVPQHTTIYFTKDNAQSAAFAATMLPQAELTWMPSGENIPARSAAIVLGQDADEVVSAKTAPIVGLSMSVPTQGAVKAQTVVPLRLHGGIVPKEIATLVSGGHAGKV